MAKRVLPVLLLVGLIAGAILYPWLAPEEEVATPPLPSPPVEGPAPPPAIPVIPVGDTEQSQAIATAASALRDQVRALHTAPTKSDLRKRKASIREKSIAIQEAGEASAPALNALL